jgi:hypothetical protein
MITGNTTFEVLDEIPDAISGGISSFKIFTTFSGSEAKPLSTAEIAGSLTPAAGSVPLWLRPAVIRFQM